MSGKRPLCSPTPQTRAWEASFPHTHGELGSRHPSPAGPDPQSAFSPLRPSPSRPQAPAVLGPGSQSPVPSHPLPVPQRTHPDSGPAWQTPYAGPAHPPGLPAHSSRCGEYLSPRSRGPHQCGPCHFYPSCPLPHPCTPQSRSHTPPSKAIPPPSHPGAQLGLVLFPTVSLRPQQLSGVTPGDTSHHGAGLAQEPLKNSGT